MRSYQRISIIASLALATACNGPYGPQDDEQRVIKQSYVHKYGVETDSKDWQERGGDGQVITTQKNGVTVSQRYVDRVLQGESTYTFPHSASIEKIAVYENGELLSETSHFPSGTKRMSTQYDPDRPENLIISQWYENGVQRSREAYINDQLDEGTYYNHAGEVENTIAQGSGTRLERDDLGLLLSSDKFYNGELVESKFYYSNGSLKEFIPYHKGNIDGVRKFYFVAGDPQKFEEWHDGQQTGIVTMFINGEKYAEIPYENGVKSGIEKRYRDGEFVVEEITWMKGKQHGTYVTHIGNETAIDWYFHDKRVSKTQFDKMSNPNVN